MHVWHDLSELPADLGRTAVTIGTFDGVHRGHRVLIDRVVSYAHVGLLPVAITFDPHPMTVVRPQLAPPMLATLAHRLELLAATGLAGVLVLPFTAELAAQSAEDFAVQVVHEAVRAATVVVGGNFRFGNRAAGDVALLTELGRRLGFDVSLVELQTLAGDKVVSSTAIRHLVAQGDVAAAAGALGHPHRLTGTVVRGDMRGRELGFPTANLAMPAGLAVPADGVYAGWASTRSDPERQWGAAISVGTNPTFDGRTRRVEAFLLDAEPDLDLYGVELHLDLVDRIREMRRFDEVTALMEQMRRDVERTRALLAG